ncbi:hypothetical protein ACWEJ6_53545 [Nonomuraea sp. NPDC004702]
MNDTVVYDNLAGKPSRRAPRHDEALPCGARLPAADVHAQNFLTEPEPS